ncbi:MAG TPA: hypothetical protein VGO96_13590, partial [Pyrinomonadaceae bacterium]|nr:hypothetical protein [Pyrinomonadaceae bacterium]
MPEVGGVGGGGVTPQGQGTVGQPGEPAAGQTNVQPGATIGQPGAPVGQPGVLGQPTGIPVPGHAQVLPDVLAGRDASQLIAA